MPDKANNDSCSSLASNGSNDQVSITNSQGPNSGPRRHPVVIHNQGGQSFDNTRPSDWDGQRWK